MPDFSASTMASPSLEYSRPSTGVSPLPPGLARKKRHPVSADSVPFFCRRIWRLAGEEPCSGLSCPTGCNAVVLIVSTTFHEVHLRPRRSAATAAQRPPTASSPLPFEGALLQQTCFTVPDHLALRILGDYQATWVPFGPLLFG